MRSPKSSLALDFVVYGHDPDAPQLTLPSRKALDEFEKHKDKLRFDQPVYGAVTLSRGSAPAATPVPDALIPLLTQLVRSIPYLIEGEVETVLFSESEHGFLLEPAQDDVLVSLFRGNDPFEPEELLLDHEAWPLEEFGEQVLSAGERLYQLMKRSRATVEDDARSLEELLETGRRAFKEFRLEVERGLRR